MYYYGYKLHAICSLKGVFQAIDPNLVNVHDIHYLNDISDQISDSTLLGDKGYLSKAVQLNLLELANIRLDTPKSDNQKGCNLNSNCLENLENESKPYFLKCVASL